MSGTDKFGRGRRARTGVVALSSAAAVALLVGLNGTFAATESAEEATAVPQQAPPVSQEMSRGYADLVERVSPAVVSVTITRRFDVASRTEGGGEGTNPFGGFPEGFDRFFGPEGGDLLERFRKFFEERGPGGRGPEFRGPPFRNGAGSGFIIDPEGYVVTNNHVVEGADEIEVTLQDGRQLQATLVGRDPKTDLALLKIETDEELPHVQWGDSDRIRVGEQVVAVGNPFGLGGSVTAGIVSARSRELGGPYDDYLQIDASINRGNSGGPTFNLDGEVVGVNSAIFSPSGGSVGIGFAISSKLAQDVVAELREHGTIERGYLGVTIQQINRDLAEGLGLQEERGALVTTIMPDSPAAKAGVERGDAILSYNGTEIRNLRDLTRAVADTDPGEQAEVVVWRDGQEVTLDVTVGTMPGEEEQLAALPEAEMGQQPEDMPQLGLGLAKLDRETRAEFGIADDVEGVLVSRVDPNSPAAEKGIRPGDVIVEAGQTAVTEPGQVAEAARKASEAGRESLLVLLHRDNADRFVAVPLAEEAAAG